MLLVIKKIQIDNDAEKHADRRHLSLPSLSPGDRQKGEPSGHLFATFVAVSDLGPTLYKGVASTLVERNAQSGISIATARNFSNWLPRPRR